MGEFRARESGYLPPAVFLYLALTRRTRFQQLLLLRPLEVDPVRTVETKVQSRHGRSTRITTSELKICAARDELRRYCCFILKSVLLYRIEIGVARELRKSARLHELLALLAPQTLDLITCVAVVWFPVVGMGRHARRKPS